MGRLTISPEIKKSKGFKKVVFSLPPPLWPLLLLFFLVSFFHFEVDKAIFPTNIIPEYFLGLSRQSWGRILFLFPVFYSALFFRYKGIMFSLITSFIILVSHSPFVGYNITEALIEGLFILALGLLVSFYYITLQDYKVDKDLSFNRYSHARQKFQSQTRATIERDKQLSALSVFSARVALSADIQDVINISLEIIQETMKVEIVAVFSLNQEKEELNLLAAKGISEERIRSQVPLRVGEGFNGIVAKTGKPIIITDAHQNPKLLKGIIKEEGINTLMIAPLISRSRTIGTLSAATRRQRIFSKQEIDILETLGAQLGVAMENSFLYNEQQVMQEQLKESEEQYQELFEKTNDIIWTEDLDGNIVSANNSCVRFFGMDSEDIIKKNIRNFIPEEALTNLVSIRQDLLEGKALEESYDQLIVNIRGTRLVLKVTTNLMESGEIKGFQHIAKDITEEKRMHENLHFYIHQITRAQEEERLRIARELHDSTAQSLIAVLHQMEKFLNNSQYLNMADSRYLWNITEQIKGTLQEVRHFSRDLRPSILDDLGLLPALEWFMEELRRTHGLETSFNVEGGDLRFLPEVEVSLFRIVQEALRNVVRHAEATKAFVNISFYDSEVVISIRDNGRGFELPKPLGDLPRSGKLGLAGMQERAKLIGGRVEISSILGKGTVVKVTTPTVGRNTQLKK